MIFILCILWEFRVETSPLKDVQILTILQNDLAQTVQTLIATKKFENDYSYFSLPQYSCYIFGQVCSKIEIRLYTNSQ